MARADEGPWIDSAPWDLAWIQCGFWLAACHVTLLPRPGAFAAAYALAFLAFWMSHRVGTVLISFGLREYRALAAAQPVRFAFLPAAWFVFAFAVIFAPASVVEASLERRLLFLLIIRFGYNAFHFGAQHYGVLSLYRLRAGQDPGSASKGLEKAFCYWAAGASMIVPFMFNAPVIRAAAAFALVVLAARVASAERAEPRPSAPKALYVLYLAAVSLAALLAPNLQRTALLIAVQHYVVATGLSTRMMANSTDALGRRPFSPAAAFALLFVLGLAPALLGYRSAHIDTVDWLFKTWWSNDGRGAGFKLAAALVYGLSYAHNAWDAAVFRLRDPSVRAVSLPLLLGPAR